MSSVKNRTLGVNLPRGEAGDRIEAALQLMREEEDRSMSNLLLHIIRQAIVKRDVEFHEEVLKRAPQYSRIIEEENPWDDNCEPILEANDDRWGDGEPG
jgi:hypothetical protein